MNEIDYDIEMFQVADNSVDYSSKLTPEEIEIQKKISKIFSEAESNAKTSDCALCKRPCLSFCNSHSVPRFALSNIAQKGMVSETIQNKSPLRVKSIGVGRTGTFRIICDTCDNEKFQDYENPSSYFGIPTNKMIAQIALKNYLLMIYKRTVEIELFTLLGKRFDEYKDYADEKVEISKHDLKGYFSSLEYAKRAISKSDDKYYHLYYYKHLDYVVPYAAQSAVTLVGDFNDGLINNIYNDSPDYILKDIHVAVFPLETTSVVMLFVEEGSKRYTKFYKQFKKLTDEEKLSVINYIVFANIENVFLNPQVQAEMIKNINFVYICGLTTDANISVTAEELSNFTCPTEILISKAIKEFSLSKRNLIPNLLNKEYALPIDEKS